MWNEITNNNDLQEFMEKIDFFHDSCIKEIKYLSGAYVNEDLSMYPINNRRALNVIIQRQFEEFPMIELVFEGLKYLRLFPENEEYTCEINDSTMIMSNNLIYWCDCGNLSLSDLDSYDGTLICASKLRWRSIDNCIGNKEFFVSIL